MILKSRLPTSIVTSRNVNQFKNRLDRTYWADQELLYDFKAKITVVTGSDAVCMSTESDEEAVKPACANHTVKLQQME